MSKPDGGRAFPEGPFSTGMSKRFYAACAAMQGALANSSSVYMPSKEQVAKGITWAMILAKEAFEVADSMLAEEAKE